MEDMFRSVQTENKDLGNLVTCFEDKKENRQL
jgi:hypothetical protein